MNVGNSIAQGLLGMVSNIPVLGAMFKPLTDALSGLFGGQQGASNVQSAMDDYSNGNLGADQLFNAVDGNFDGSSASDNGGPADQLKQLLASRRQSATPADGEQLMQLLQSLQGGSGGPRNSHATAMTAPGASAISF